MADAPVVHIGENSPEYVAYKLMNDILRLEKHQTISRKLLLDTYSECIEAAKGYRAKPAKWPSEIDK